MKRGVEACISMYLALYRKYLDRVLSNSEDIKERLKDLAEVHANLLANHRTTDRLILIEKDAELLKEVGKYEFIKLQEDFDKSLVNQAKFLRQYMKMVDLLLLFIRATRQSLWTAHLTTLEMVKYFFALDLQNYARLTPVYISQMYTLKKDDPVIWDFLENSNFTVNKSDVPFCSIGVDHAIEHENRAMQVISIGAFPGARNS